jgi:GH25 family lysozyme M1 (1,4-beta-N-acetylmuramidase)
MSLEPVEPSSLLNPAYRVFGADTSPWSLAVDFDKYKAAGATFVIVKALRGKDLDPYFKQNHAGARKAGIAVSSFQWLVPPEETSISDQVEAYRLLLQEFPHDFLPWLDYEGESVRPRDLTRYLDAFEEKVAREIGVYSAYGRLNDAIPPLPEGLSTRKLWIAHYATSFPQVPRRFTRWDFWQFTENFPAESFGFPAEGEHHVDMNYFNGSPETFLAFCDPAKAGSPQDRLERQIEWEVPKAGLETGARGIEVLKLQDLLVKFSFMTTAQTAAGPGIFGARTKVALIRVQTALGLPSSGIYDNELRTAVVERYYRQPGPPPISVPAPRSPRDDEPVEEKALFNGNAVYRKYIARFSRGEVPYHVVKADLSNAEIFVSPRPTGLSFVPTFVDKYGTDIAINGDGWTTTGFLGLQGVETTGENVSRGQPYGRKENEGTFYFDRHNRLSLERPSAKDLWNGLSFPNILVENGEISRQINRTDIDPRTALGFTKDRKYAILVAVDGLETVDELQRSGMNFEEVATILIRHGAWIGSNQDGGGSTTLVVRDELDGQVRILNEPCGEDSYTCRNRAYNLRPVANIFGLRFIASTP